MKKRGVILKIIMVVFLTVFGLSVFLVGPEQDLVRPRLKKGLWKLIAKSFILPVNMDG